MKHFLLRIGNGARGFAVRSTELAPHQLFAFCYLCCLVFLAKIVATGHRVYWYAAWHAIA